MRLTPARLCRVNPLLSFSLRIIVSRMSQVRAYAARARLVISDTARQINFLSSGEYK